MKSSVRILIVILLTAGLAVLLAQPRHQYKKNPTNGMAMIVDGQYDQAISHFDAQFNEYVQDFQVYHDVYPVDLEALYGKAVAFTQQDKLDSALKYVQLSVENGLSPARYLAGPRELLAPLYDYPQFQKYIQGFDIQLIHGPVLGQLTSQSASFWVRTVDEVRVQVIAKTAGQSGGNIISARTNTSSAADFTGNVTLNNLQPNTTYQYELIVDGNKLPQKWEFRTASINNAPSQFEIGFGGGAGFTPWYERMWNTIAAHELDAFLLLGDNVYIDHPEYPAVQRYCYYRRQSRPEYRNFAARTPLFSIWDDHDFTVNDGWGGPAIDEPAWKIPVWGVFKENWNNPAYGGGEEQPGCWFDFTMADVHFIMLDGRYYRENPKNDEPSMLGPAQKKWLFETLTESDATFKILASPVPWAKNTKPGSPDTWDGYAGEREEIFRFLEENEIEGVILISADRHRSDIWKIVRPDGYDFYEFESSKLTNVHTHDPMPDALFSYNDKCSFGKLLFNTTGTDPSVTYQIYSIDNELIHSFKVSRSQLSL